MSAHLVQRKKANQHSLIFKNDDHGTGSSSSFSSKGSETSERDGEEEVNVVRSDDSVSATRGSSKFHAPRSSSIRASSRCSEGLTLDVLQLSRLSLYGRSEETKKLLGCWESVLFSDASKSEEKTPSKRHGSGHLIKRQFVIVSGPSGTGKSALVRQLEMPVEDAGGFFAIGKFDFHKKGEPYYGVAAACHKLWLSIANIQNRRKTEGSSALSGHTISQKIKFQLGSDMQVLLRLLPTLNEVLGFDSAEERSETLKLTKEDGLGMLEERNRFNYVFRRFLRIVCSFGPVVLVLDDMQWIDVASMDLLKYLIQDAENPRLMVVGLYRSNEVDDAHLMTQMIRDISDEPGVNTTKLEIGNLSVSHVNELLDDLLYTDSEKSQKLAEIIQRKTSGNVFFVIQFLLALNAHELLTYDFGMLCWRWDEDKIESWTAATANVVDLMREKLTNLDPNISKKLPLVAWLGATFKNRLLALVLDSFDEIRGHLSTEPLQKTEVRRINSGAAAIQMLSFLEVCKSEGIIEKVDTDSHRWIHDKIQEASLLLISESKQKEWRFMTGRVLKDNLFGEEIEENLFLIVSLFEDTVDLIPAGDNFRIEVSRYFLRAGKKAQASNAFRQAAFYLNKGIELLPEKHWNTHYKLSLELFSSAAEAEYCYADIEKMEEHCNEVLARENVPLQHKFRCYLNLVEGPARHNDLAGAIGMTLSILEKLGCKFPRKAFHFPVATKQLMSWKGKLSNKISKEQIDSLDEMTDRKRIFCMHLLEKLDPFCYISGNLNLFILVVLKRIEWTIKYGYCLHSASAFSSIGIVYTGALGDITLGNRCAQYCLSLQEIVGARSTESGNLLRCFALNLHYTTPLQTCMKGLLSGYQVGIEMGDLTSAMFGIYQYLELCRASGKSLEVLDEDYCTYVPQMKETQQMQALGWALVEHQGVRNLMGCSENTVILAGDVMDQEEVLATVESSQNLALRYLIRRKQMYLACFLDDHKFGADLALEYGNATLQSLAGSNGAISQCFLSALSCLSAYRETKRGKYKRYAKAMTVKIQDLIKKGDPNIGHYGLLLDAEWKTLNRMKRSQANKSYEQANKIAGRSGFIHDRALINERYAEFLFAQGKEECASDARYRLEESIKLYAEWGAGRKVEILNSKFGFASNEKKRKNLSFRGSKRVGYVSPSA